MTKNKGTIDGKVKESGNNSRGGSDEKMKEFFSPSGMSFEKKKRVLNNLRARIIANDPALRGLLTYVPSKVVPDGHFMYNSVAYTNGDCMYFADKFFSQVIPIQCAIILHEMFHVVFRHVSRGRKRIHRLWNIANDALINDGIGYKENQAIDATQQIYLPKKHCVSLESVYDEVGIDERQRKTVSQLTSEELYEQILDFYREKLKEEAKKKQEEGKQQDGEKQGDPGQEGECDDCKKAGGQNPGAKKGKKGGKRKSNKPGSGGSGSHPDGDPESEEGGDSPANGGNIGGAPQQSSGGGTRRKKEYANTELGDLEREIDDLLDRLGDKHKMFGGDDLMEGDDTDPTNEEINNSVWTERYNRAKSQGVGRGSVLGRVNADVYKPQIPWHRELRKYLVKRCMPLTQNTFTKPARRMTSLRAAGSSNAYLPGVQKMKGLDKMMVIIDTSGSCFNEEELTMFTSEIESVQNQTGVEVALIFADTEIRSEQVVKADGTGLLDKIKMGWITPEGGGGTDMVRPFVEGKKKYKPILTVIASDGFTPFPTAQQVRGTNLLWIINTTVEVPPEAGKALYIKPKGGL